MSSTSGINLSSILAALGSSSSGINVTEAVDSAIAAMSAPMNEWQSEQSALATKTSDLNQIQTDVNALETSLSALQDSSGALASLTATSSDNAVVNATASAGAAVGTHVVVVNNIATTASAYSSSVATSTTALGAGSFTLTVGTGTPTTITIGSGVNTLDDVASDINGLNLGVTASIVTDSSGARLSITSNSTGSAAGFTLGNVTGGLTFTQPSTGEDASLTVDGIPIDSASNTVAGAVNGLTLNLTGADPGGQVSITVAPDTTTISEAIATFVGDYNTAMADVNTQYTVGATNQEGPLAGDPTISMLQDALLSVASYSGGSNGVSTLADLGITMNKDGTLTLDSSTLTSAIQNNFSAVQTFMQGASSTGFAASLNNQLDTLTTAASGAFTVDLQSISSENSDLQDRINNFQAYLNTQQTRLTAEYSQADIALQELPMELKQISAELGQNTSSSSS
ncbi:MAG: flagellar filament capping protein FliD [Terriglobales bacterium]